MRIARIYVDTALNVGKTIEFGHRTHHHLTHVLRLRTGQRLRVFNGKGGEYEGTFNRLENGTSGMDINRFINRHRESAVKTSVLQGISRSEHMSFTLQKTVELGVHEICPVITQRSGPRLDALRIKKKMRHWEQIIISSCEQSGRTHLPKLHPPLTLTEVFATRPSHFGIVLDPSSDKDLSDLPPDIEQIAILVGAEGGLTEEEIRLAVNNGFRTIRLGPRTLRTETAGIAALAAVQTLWGDFS